MTEIKPRFESNIYVFSYIINPNHFYLIDKKRFDKGMIESAEAMTETYVKKHVQNRLTEFNAKDVSN